jgi:hypothetical protein
MTTRHNTWLLRVAWATLPLSSGNAAAAALRGWDTAPSVVAAVLLWSLWTVVLAATVVPRPVTFTITRVGTPLAVAAALLAALTGRPSASAAFAAVVATIVCWVLAALPWWGCACAQGAAYGDEERFPLKVPPALFIGILPFALAVIGLGIALGPLLIADGRWIVGAIVLVLGAPAAAVTGRLVHVFARRWLVLVPAGLVIADPMTLADPVLFMRPRIDAIGPADPRQRPPSEALDLRLGAAFGSLAVLLHDDAEMFRRTGRTATAVQAHLLFVTPVLSKRFLQRAGSRRIRVRS